MGFPFPHGVTSYLSGGLLLGLGLMVTYLTLGVKAGASSFLSSTLTYVTPLRAERSSSQWRLLFALGLVLGAWLFASTHQEFFTTTVSGWRLALGGLLVGFGTQLSSGCTSGHGICGVASFSKASLLGLPFSQEVKRMLPGTVPGAVIFGVGWGLSAGTVGRGPTGASETPGRPSTSPPSPPRQPSGSRT